MRKIFSLFVLIFLITLITSPVWAWTPAQRLTWTAGDSSCPDVNDISSLKSIIINIQKLISENKILSGHDVSDGGLIT
ncbi:MAG: hypothetical protein ACK2TU_07020, partial [Anaerolineales bacterium]